MLVNVLWYKGDFHRFTVELSIMSLWHWLEHTHGDFLHCHILFHGSVHPSTIGYVHPVFHHVLYQSYTNHNKICTPPKREVLHHLFSTGSASPLKSDVNPCTFQTPPFLLFWPSQTNTLCYPLLGFLLCLQSISLPWVINTAVPLVPLWSLPTTCGSTVQAPRDEEHMTLTGNLIILNFLGPELRNHFTYSENPFLPILKADIRKDHCKVLN